MPAPDIVDRERVSTEDHSNNVRAPPTTGFFQRALGRVSSALNHRQQNVGENQIERGEHNPQDEGTITRNEETSSPEGAGIHGPLAESTTAQQEQHSPFSSRAFDWLPQPVPVEDVFFGLWWLVLAQRTVSRPAVIYLSIFWLWPSVISSLVLSAVVTVFLLRWVLLKAGRNTIPLIGGPIPGKSQLFWACTRWIQKIWEHVFAIVLLKSGGRHSRLLTQFWWYNYLLIAPMAEFRQNYLAAWRQRERLAIHIFVDDENMSIPIPDKGTDEDMLACIRTFYQMMLVGQGFPALVFPKQLQRIDYAEVSSMSLASP